MTRIEWTDQVWNPTTGCDRISAGCDRCYALAMAKRLKAMGAVKYQADGNPATSGPGFALALHPGALALPFTWHTPRRVFVNSMSDLFHARVPLDFVRQVLAVIEATPQHTYQALTKRAGRLGRLGGRLTWPANLHMGVSVENSQESHRIDALRKVPAALRWISAEPLIGPLDGLDLDGIGWVVVGGESGHGARPIDLDWVRGITAQCAAQGVPVFVKQLGKVWARGANADAKGGDWQHWPADLRIRQFPETPHQAPDDAWDLRGGRR